MKSLSSFPFFVLFIAIFSIIIAFMSPVEADDGHNIWIHNKLDKATQALAAVTYTNEKETWHWSPDNNDAIFSSYSFAHTGFYLNVPSKVKSYWLVFGVGLSFEEDKWRGPFDNTQDLCFHFHGNVVKWELWQC